MPDIFISYRRQDSGGHAGRLFDRLVKHFGNNHVFLDVAGIELGVDFVETIEEAVGSSDAVVVVIGRAWLDCTDAQGRRRLDDPKDFIRLEVATAFLRGVRVIPVLVQGASMPSSEYLPQDLEKLPKLQAIELRDARWGSDVSLLIESLENIAPLMSRPRAAAHGRDSPITIAALAAVVQAILIGGWGIMSQLGWSGTNCRFFGFLMPCKVGGGYLLMAGFCLLLCGAALAYRNRSALPLAWLSALMIIPAAVDGIIERYTGFVVPAIGLGVAVPLALVYFATTRRHQLS